MSTPTYATRFAQGAPRNVLPPTQHVVRHGECLSSIAAKYGLASWHVLHTLADNADLARLRPNPNVLLPGDVVVIPPREESTLQVQPGQANQFKATLDNVNLKLKLQAPDGSASASCKYELAVGPRRVSGTTSAGGEIECRIPAGELVATLDVWLRGASESPTRLTLAVGGIDPHDTVSGALGRLTALGFPCEAGDGGARSMTRQSITAFQRQHRLTVTGEAGLETMNKLRECYGC